MKLEPRCKMQNVRQIGICSTRLRSSCQDPLSGSLESPQVSHHGRIDNITSSMRGEMEKGGTTVASRDKLMRRLSMASHAPYPSKPYPTTPHAKHPRFPVPSETLSPLSGTRPRRRAYWFLAAALSMLKPGTTMACLSLVAPYFGAN